MLLDFYGTLARASRWLSVDTVLAEHGYALDPKARRRWFDDGIDGMEHAEHSLSREHYMAWQRERTLAMLAESDVHPGEHELILEKLRVGNAQRVLEAYDEVPAVLDALAERDLLRVVCSNWDWDLAEALDDAGLAGRVDVIVSSAWAGARKPHPRIFGHTLRKAGLPASDALFVGDTWGPDVEGPLAAGMRAVYLRRDGHWPDPTCPSGGLESRPGVTLARDLAEILDVLDREAP